MKRLLILAVILCVPIAEPAAKTEEEIAAEFMAFAEKEAKRLEASWRVYEDKFLSEVSGMAIPLTIPKKFAFSGTKLESVPDTYAFDVRRTDSIITPYQAHIEFPIVVVQAAAYVTGKKKFCRDKPLQACLDGGGRIIKGGWLYKNMAFRFPKTFRYEYVYQDDQWKPKQDFDVALAAAIAAMSLTSPLQPSDAAEILGQPNSEK